MTLSVTSQARYRTHKQNRSRHSAGMNFVGRRTVDNCQRFARSQKAMHIFAATSEHTFAFPLRQEMQAALTWALFRRNNGGSDGFSFCEVGSLVRKETFRRSGVDTFGAISLGVTRLFIIALRFRFGGKNCQYRKAMLLDHPLS